MAYFYSAIFLKDIFSLKIFDAQIYCREILCMEWLIYILRLYYPDLEIHHGDYTRLFKKDSGSFS